MNMIGDRFSHTDLAEQYLKSLDNDSIFWYEGVWYEKVRGGWDIVSSVAMQARLFRHMVHLRPDISDIIGAYRVMRLGRHVNEKPTESTGATT